MAAVVRYLHAIRYTDDKAMMSQTNEGLQRIINARKYTDLFIFRFLNETHICGMKINAKKIKVMTFSRKPGKVVRCTFTEYNLSKLHLSAIWDPSSRKTPEARKKSDAEFNGESKILRQPQGPEKSDEHQNQETAD